MRNPLLPPPLLLLLVPCALLLACAAGELHPCVKGGEPSRDKAAGEVKIGTRQCVQHRSPGGDYLNDGRYREWFPSGRLSLEGEYKLGKRNGKWVEWDGEGKQLSERWFEDGKETATRETKVEVAPATALPPASAPSSPRSAGASR